MPDLEWYLYAKPGTPIQGREFRLGNAVIRSRAFGVIHAAIQSYPQWGIGIWSAQRGIPALSVTSLRIKFYSSLNIVNCSIAYIYIYIYIYIQSWKQCLSPQWLCGNSYTWAHDVRFFSHCSSVTMLSGERTHSQGLNAMMIPYDN